MSDTPRTDEKVLIAWECFAPTKYVSADFARQLEREIARLQMELDSTCNAEELRQTRAENAALTEQAERYRLASLKGDAELAALRHDLSVAKNWVEHHSKHADDLIAVNVALRAAGNEMARIIDIPGDAPIEGWASEEEIDSALKAWRAALKGGAK